MTTLVRTPRLSVPVLAAPPATEAQARHADALALAAQIPAAATAAFSAHVPAPRG